MALRVNYNGTASSALRGFSSSQARFDRSSARLASGRRIGSASDDAGGMTIAEGFKGQTRGYLQAKRNIQDGISLLQTAEAALAEDHALLSRMRELATGAASDTLTDSDRALLNAEFTQLRAEIDRIASSTNFNGTPLLMKDDAVSTHAGGTGLTLQVGANAGDRFTVTIPGARTQDLGDVKSLSSVLSGAQSGTVTVTPTGAGSSPVTVTVNVDTSSLLDVRDVIRDNQAVLGVRVQHADGVLYFTSWDAFSISDTTGTVAARLGIATAAQRANAGGSDELGASGSFDITDGTNTASVAYQSSDTFDQLAVQMSTAISAATGSGGLNIAGASVAFDGNTGALTFSGITSETLTFGSGAAAPPTTFGLPGTITSASLAGSSATLPYFQLTSTGIASGVTPLYDADTGGIGVGTRQEATTAITVLDAATNLVSSARAQLGAQQNRMESQVRSLSVAAENSSAATSVITDADIASEVSEMIRADILMRAATSILAQANQSPSVALQLLR